MMGIRNLSVEKVLVQHIKTNKNLCSSVFAIFRFCSPIVFKIKQKLLYYGVHGACQMSGFLSVLSISNKLQAVNRNYQDVSKKLHKALIKLVLSNLTELF